MNTKTFTFLLLLAVITGKSYAQNYFNLALEEHTQFPMGLKQGNGYWLMSIDTFKDLSFMKFDVEGRKTKTYLLNNEIDTLRSRPNIASFYPDFKGQTIFSSYPGKAPLSLKYSLITGHVDLATGQSNTHINAPGWSQGKQIYEMVSMNGGLYGVGTTVPDNKQTLQDTSYLTVFELDQYGKILEEHKIRPQQFQISQGIGERIHVTDAAVYNGHIFVAITFFNHSQTGHLIKLTPGGDIKSVINTGHFKDIDYKGHFFDIVEDGTRLCAKNTSSIDKDSLQQEEALSKPKVMAFDQSGQKLWNTDLGYSFKDDTNFVAGAVENNGNFYVGINENPGKVKVYKLDSETGNILWDTKVAYPENFTGLNRNTMKFMVKGIPNGVVIGGRIIPSQGNSTNFHTWLTRIDKTGCQKEDCKPKTRVEYPNPQAILKVFPNPAKRYFKVKFPQRGSYQVKILNNHGQLMDVWTTKNTRSMKKSIEAYPQGHYFYRVRNNKGQFIEQGKLIKMRN